MSEPRSAEILHRRQRTRIDHPESSRERAITGRARHEPASKRTRVVGALRDQGWPMTGDTDGASGCRPVRGVFTWADHCLSIHPTTEFVEPRQTTHPGAIVLWASSQ